MRPNQILTWQQHNSNTWWREKNPILFFQWIFDAYVFFSFFELMPVYVNSLSIWPTCLYLSFLPLFFIITSFLYSEHDVTASRKLANPSGPFSSLFQKLLLILKGQLICSIGHELSCVDGKHCVVVSTKMKDNNKQQVDLWVVEFIVFIVSVNIRKENKDEVLNSIKNVAKKLQWVLQFHCWYH